MSAGAAGPSSAGLVPPIRGVMPTLLAMLLASLAGWLVEAPIRATLGPVASVSASFVAAVFAFYVAKRFLADLRGDS